MQPGTGELTIPPRRSLCPYAALCRVCASSAVWALARTHRLARVSGETMLIPPSSICLPSDPSVVERRRLEESSKEKEMVAKRGARELGV